MLRKRLIFTLIYSDGFFNQSRNFRLQKVGDINWLEENYGFKDLAFSLDELIVLDASRGKRDVAKFVKNLSKLAEDVFIPICAGGGIECLDDAKILFDNGADKIILNTAVYDNIGLVTDLVEKYGSQSIVASVDYRCDEVFINNGTVKVDKNLEDHLENVELLGVGEIYLNSIDKDGTGFGYDLKTVAKVIEKIKAPLIIAGGAGNEAHLAQGLNIDCINAVATANLFNFIGDGLPNARAYMIENNCNLVNW
mgnify:CR=1 FL=1